MYLLIRYQNILTITQAWKEIFPYSVPWTNVIFLCSQVNTEMEDFAASGGMTGQAWCSRFLFLSSLEFPIVDNTEMSAFAGSGGMTGQA